MPALSKKQQRFFGIVRAIQKGEMAPTTPETAKAAADMKKKDVKDFASTKHKGLPEKKVSKEEKDFSQKDKIMKKVKSLHKHLYKNLHKGDKSGDVNEGFKTLNKKILIDTTIPLLGEKNAFKIFGPQKGLKKSEIKHIEK